MSACARRGRQLQTGMAGGAPATVAPAPCLSFRTPWRTARRFRRLRSHGSGRSWRTSPARRHPHRNHRNLTRSRRLLRWRLHRLRLLPAAPCSLCAAAFSHPEWLKQAALPWSCWNDSLLPPGLSGWLLNVRREYAFCSTESSRLLSFSSPTYSLALK